MYWKKETYKNEMEILYSTANLVTFSGTVKNTNVKPDEHGKKYVLSGSLIDANGNVVTQTGVAGSEALSATPVAVLYRTVDVTQSDEPGSFIVEGYLRADRVLNPFVDKIKDTIKKSLPNIKFR